MRLFCFGFGYSAEALARRLSARTAALAGTRTSLVDIEPSLTIPRVRLGQYVRVLIDRSTHEVISFEVAPRSLGSGDVEAAKQIAPEVAKSFERYGIVP